MAISLWAWHANSTFTGLICDKLKLHWLFQYQISSPVDFRQNKRKLMLILLTDPWGLCLLQDMPSMFFQTGEQDLSAQDKANYKQELTNLIEQHFNFPRYTTLFLPAAKAGQQCWTSGSHLTCTVICAFSFWGLSLSLYWEVHNLTRQAIESLASSMMEEYNWPAYCWPSAGSITSIIV